MVVSEVNDSTNGWHTSGPKGFSLTQNLEIVYSADKSPENDGIFAPSHLEVNNRVNGQTVIIHNGVYVD